MPNTTKDKCFVCGLPFDGRVFTEAGKRETAISGMCEVCFDEITREDEEQDPDFVPVPPVKKRREIPDDQKCNEDFGDDFKRSDE